MKMAPSRTVGEIATVYPDTVRVFESKGIDYCCGGKRMTPVFFGPLVYPMRQMTEDHDDAGVLADQIRQKAA